MDNPLPRAIFLDRDGTLNRETGYLHSWKDWQWLPGVPQALALLRGRGYKLIVVSNQAGLARGFYADTDVQALHLQVNQSLAAYDTAIDAFYYCPHHPDVTGLCSCRKPEPGMLLRAAADFGLSLDDSWMIGDKTLDIEAGMAAGCRSVLVRTGYGRQMESGVPASVPVVDDLSAAAAHILRNAGQTGKLPPPEHV